MAARPLVARQPNERLQALIQEAGCSNAGLARRVNMVGAERGLDLRYDKTSVARWLRGQQPRGRAPGIIAEALGRKLGRTVTIDEIGMANGKNLASGVGLQFAPTVLGAIEQVCELWRSDVGRRDFLTGSTVAASALVEPSRDWLITGADAQVARQAGARVGLPDVEAVRAMTKALTGLDHRFGAGHVRPVVVHYLNSVVSGLLSGSYREPVGRQLFAAVARLTELAGYMAVDTGQPGLAQRYYIQALRLAQAAGDRAYGGYVLAASMSHLAAELGNPREIAQLARAAQEGARGQVTPRAEAMFHAAEARGHALLGDVRTCQESAGRAVAALDRANPDSGDDPDWIAHFDQAYLADELAHCHRDLGQADQAARRASESLDGHPESRARRRGIGLVLLATARLQQREVEEACRTGTRAIELLGTLRSSRGTEYLEDLNQRLEPFAAEPSVREFGARLQLQAA
ncbi:transcriptional regulator [Streptomyces sp. ICN441]|uniref:Transcriptional regulator n=1 Tax=Streptomyces tirandamycinicus TaxID=2174846 RepID=A0A2S1STE7_9ACTN|nr:MULTISPECIES: transcriptional regulator [Streptomyces]AWI29662.1 transcriptional regulator [Streptomyces tirandamycinicus]MCY0980942.1 transcriptional regulator [Streptomyces tirandamycinicus]NNJ03230.1 transcriptional regulator [Streptomyces sp. PKU-MA01144]TFE48088.1 transcriptional regulator [Streptomyces sp. ICN441]